MQPGHWNKTSGSTLGPRDPGGAIDSIAGPQEREAADAARQGSDAAPARPAADAVRAAAGDLLGDAGLKIRCSTTKLAAQDVDYK